MNDKNEYLFAEPGMHLINDPFMEVVREPARLHGHITHGDRTIVIVDQGHIGYATDNGQPVMLPPGIHVWKSDSLAFIKSFPLDSHCIKFGPYTLLTVDEGYSAVCQENGKQVILSGGHTHFLHHKNFKFEKFVTLKIQTSDLPDIGATSADNVNIMVTSTVIWRIQNPQLAAIMAAETMAPTGKDADVSTDLTKLRRDVLKQALASLSSFIGSVNYSGSFHISAADKAHKAEAQQRMTTAIYAEEAVAAGASAGAGAGPPHTAHLPAAALAPVDDNLFLENPLYNQEKMQTAMVRSSVSVSATTRRTHGLPSRSIALRLQHEPIPARLPAGD